MLYATINDVKIMVYTKQDTIKYDQVAGDPRPYIRTGVYPFLDLGNSLFTRSSLTRGDLYKAMGYKTFDFAFPQPWADSPEGQVLMSRYGKSQPIVDPDTGKTTGYRPWKVTDGYPALVWCYDPKDGSDRSPIFGYPVFDRDVISALGQKIHDMICSIPTDPAIEHIKWPWADPDYDPDLESETA